MAWEVTLGARVLDGGVRFRVWSTNAEQVDVELQRGRGNLYIPMSQVEDQVYEATLPEASAGSLYRFRMDRSVSYPDPCSRFQPRGVHGPSLVVDPGTYAWRISRHPAPPPEGLILYELHVGAYTPAGTYGALLDELPRLRELGVNAIELMPLHTSAGSRNWGYDGVALFAPYPPYGTPDELKALVDRAHELGLLVILDVVYTHLGPEGNYLWAFSREYFTHRYDTPWGEALNMAHPRVRRFFIENALYWLSEYRFDGLRLDATFMIFDPSPVHVMAELVQRVRQTVPHPVVLIAEDHRNETRVVRADGWGMDMVWTDDFQHVLHVLLTGERHGVHRDYHGSAEELVRCLKEGFLYQGQHSHFVGQPRGTRVKDEPARAFVFYCQNHDITGNRPGGQRLHHLVRPEQHRAAAALLLLAPQTPLLFMGQEFAASTPFHYFTDHSPELGQRIRESRKVEYQIYFGYAGPSSDPQKRETFEQSKLRLAERQEHAETYDLYRELIRLRKEDAVLRHQDRERLEAVALGREALRLRRWNASGEDRLICVNFGPAKTFELDRPRRLLLATSPVELTDQHVRFNGPAAVLLA